LIAPNADLLDPFRFSKFKPLARGKQRDTFTLSGTDGTTGHILEGAVRSSKTIVSIVRWLLFVTEGPPGGLAMIGKTERALKRNVLDVIVSLLGPKRAKIVQGSGIMRICGREVYLAGANDEAAVAKIQGMTLVGFYGDEAPTWPQSVFDMARTRCSDPGAQWFVTGNPAASTHHLKTDWIDRAAVHLRRDGTIVRRSLLDPATQDVTVYSFTIYDNPHLSAQFIQLLERSYQGVFRKRYILGEWCLAEGAIYDAWDEDRHVLPFDRIPPLTRWISAGVDYGTVNPFHAVTLALGPLPSHVEARAGVGLSALYITSEHRYSAGNDRRRRTDLEHAFALQQWLARVPTPGAAEVRGFRPDPLAVDPSAASFRVQLYGLGIESAAADNAVLPGIRDMASLIAHDRLFICDAAPELIKEIPGYVWDPAAAAKGEDRPLKVADHGCDAKRYAARTARDAWWDDVFPDQLPVSLLDQLGAVSLGA
jgi:PBSX family phage terminase large subunit